MVLDISGALFKQSDVRETPAETATATVTSITNGKYIVVDYDADLTDERKITAGEGIDFTDNGANGTFIIAGEDSTAVNKGIVIVGAGEGINVSYASGTATVSGEDASTVNKGIASFDTNHFSVASGAVSIKNRTFYWSCPGVAFMGDGQEGAEITRDHVTGDITASANNRFFVHVSLPHGAIVTGVIVYGSNAAPAFYLKRVDHAGNTTDMALANVNTEDTSITAPTIDNQNYSYMLNTTETNIDIYGARITYTFN